MWNWQWFQIFFVKFAWAHHVVKKRSFLQSSTFWPQKRFARGHSNYFHFRHIHQHFYTIHQHFYMIHQHFYTIHQHFITFSQFVHIMSTLVFNTICAHNEHNKYIHSNRIRSHPYSLAQIQRLKSNTFVVKDFKRILNLVFPNIYFLGTMNELETAKNRSATIYDPSNCVKHIFLYEGWPTSRSDVSDCQNR